MKEDTLPKLDKTDWEILNATADDCENLEQIYRTMSFEPNVDGAEIPTGYQHSLKGAPLLCDIADRVKRLIECGLLSIVMDENGQALNDLNDLSYVWRAWFAMTPQGRKDWTNASFCLEQQELS
jgi:hypothetical protein